jgi:hypothetical protein
MSASSDISKLLAGLAKAKIAKLNAAIRAVDIFGEQVIGDAQQLTPVKTGALQASGTTLPAEVNQGKVTKMIGFNTNYAAAVHERLELHHEIGQAKFLYTAMRNNQNKFAPFVAAKVAEVSD